VLEVTGVSSAAGIDAGDGHVRRPPRSIHARPRAPRWAWSSLRGTRAPARRASADEAMLAGVAAAWARGLELDVIVTGVATFRSDLDPFSQLMADDGIAAGTTKGS